jgi:hypothetical protein
MTASEQLNAFELADGRGKLRSALDGMLDLAAVIADAKGGMSATAGIDSTALTVTISVRVAGSPEGVA